jgi:GNAT superfamily N-acetyltransferase
MHSNEFSIACLVPANADDVNALGNLFHRYWTEDIGVPPGFDEGKYLASVQKRASEPGRWCLLAKDRASEPTGFSWFKIDQDERVGWGYILEFYVRPENRRQGLGRQLFEQSCKLLADSGVRQAWLTSDPSAEVFWLKCGFQFTGEAGDNGHKIMIAML